MEFEENPEVKIDIFPLREYNNRPQEFFFYIPSHIGKLYSDSVKAYNQELFLFTTAGIRALIEAIVIDKFQANEYKNSLKSKIDALRKFFDQKIIDTLHEFRMFGNTALHEFNHPEPLDLHRALNVIEDMLTFFYKIEESTEFYHNNRDEKNNSLE